MSISSLVNGHIFFLNQETRFFSTDLLKNAWTLKISTSKLREIEDDIGKPEEQVAKKTRPLFSYNRNKCEVAIKEDLAT